jgi:diguanylate cyclase (GGDEF)-like protein
VEGVLRRPGDLAARFGGEEFAVLLPATDASGAMLIAEQIRESVAALGIAHLDSAHAIVTISAGIGSARPGAEGGTPADLIRAADRALYEAKLAGRNQVRATPAVASA